MNAADINNVVANGRHCVGIPHTPYTSNPVPAVLSRAKKVPECPVLGNRNWLIHLHYARKELGVCKILIQEDLEKSKGMSEYANYVMGLILRHEGKIQESLEYFQTCHSLNPKSVDNMKQVARSLFLLGRHRLAMEAYLEAERVPQKPDWEIYHNLGMCLMHLNELEKAKGYISKAIQLSSQECSYIALAKICLLHNDIQGALHVYTIASEQYPDSAEIATCLGLLYIRANLFQQAFEKLGSALAHDPTFTKALLAAGSMMQNHQEFDVALSKYKLASHHKPESAVLWSNIGLCFFQKKKYVAAISSLKRANYLAPTDWKILYNLGLVHLATQQYASAFHFLSTSINLQPNSGNSFMLLALTLKHLGDQDNANQAFQQASKLSPTNASIPLNFSIFLHSMGAREKAIIQLKRFTDLAQSQKGQSQEMVDTANSLSAVLSEDDNATRDIPRTENTDSEEHPEDINGRGEKESGERDSQDTTQETNTQIEMAADEV
ncbi:hypothetical protein R5R35_006950 [Gryllus longicercus]|uniref:Bardet-Biedl syndrome 4 n=1 Tax=Gryllus longicercus TaxID=2509291 RepID=A0AAN9VYA8_9ORTH